VPAEELAQNATDIRGKHAESLEHLYRAAVQNTDDDSSTSCIEPLYKLHATRAKILLGA